MVEERPLCPECGYPLSVSMEKNDKTGEIQIGFWCEGPGSDQFDLRISTGLVDDDLDDFKVGKVVRKEMKIKLLEREADPSEDL